MTLMTSMVFWPQGAFAQFNANLQEGSFNWTSRDDIKDEGKLLSLSRDYSSRSTYQGIFGLGWCSQLEWRLFRTESTWLLQKCDEIKPLTKALVRKFKKFQSVKTNQGVNLLFGEDGRLTAFREKRNLWQVNRDRDGRALSLLSPQKRILTLTYDPKSQLLKQMAENSYQYRTNQLSAASKEEYFYDEFSNLEKVERGGKVLVQAHYDSQKDVVVCIEELHQCTTRYEYHSQDTSRSLVDEVRSVKICPHQKPKADLTTFEYHKSTDHEVLLDRTSVQTEKGE